MQLFESASSLSASENEINGCHLVKPMRKSITPQNAVCVVEGGAEKINGLFLNNSIIIIFEVILSKLSGNSVNNGTDLYRLVNRCYNRPIDSII